MIDHLKKAKNYHQTIRRALLKEWDPIGIGSIDEAQDEYDAYVPVIYKMLIGQKPVGEIFEYLWWLETTHMGLVGDRQLTEQFAKRLADLASQITEGPPTR